MQHVATCDDLLESILQYNGEVEVYMGLDPAVKTLGVFVIVGNIYCSFTEVLKKTTVKELMYSPVECGKMIGEAFAPSRKSKICHLVEWLSCMWQVRRVYVAIEDTPSISKRGRSPYTPPAAYWGSALAALCSSKSTFDVRAANISSVKSNFGLAAEGDHSANKVKAVQTVRGRLGLTVYSDHEADAFLCLSTIFFPRLSPSTSRTTTRRSSPLLLEQQINEYFIELPERFKPYVDLHPTSVSSSGLRLHAGKFQSEYPSSTSRPDSGSDATCV